MELNELFTTTIPKMYGLAVLESERPHVEDYSDEFLKQIS